MKHTSAAELDNGAIKLFMGRVRETWDGTSEVIQFVTVYRSGEVTIDVANEAGRIVFDGLPRRAIDFQPAVNATSTKRGRMLIVSPGTEFLFESRDEADGFRKAIRDAINNDRA